MNAFRYPLFSVACIVVSTALTGCDPSGASLLSRISGHYEGSLTDHRDSKTYSQISVSTDIAKGAEADPFVISITDPTGNFPLKLSLSKVSSSSLTLQVDPGLTQQLALSLDSSTPDSGCYEGQAAVKIYFCLSESEISLEIRDIQNDQQPAANSDLLFLVLHRFEKNTDIPAPEAPRKYTLTEAIDRARNQSFSSRIEFEHVVQAKLAARAAYLHLLPQITMGTILNNVTVSPLNLVATFTTVLQDIGDLAPFLLPDRWLLSDAASRQSLAEEDAMTLMRLDMGQQIEGLFYAYDRDRATRDLTQSFLNTDAPYNLGSIRERIRTREAWGLLPRGSTLNIDLVINQVQQSLSVLSQLATEDLAAISQSLGYFNPTTVTDAVIDSELQPIEQAQPVDFNSINAVASCQTPNGSCRSFELMQMDELIAVAQDQKEAKYFSWLDPVGDPSLGLGFALPSEIELSSSQIRELRIDRQQLQSLLSSKVLYAVTDYQQALSSYRIAQEGVSKATELRDITITNIETGVSNDLFGLVSSLQNLLSANISLQTAIANYRVAHSEIDRLLLQGHYANF